MIYIIELLQSGFVIQHSLNNFLIRPTRQSKGGSLVFILGSLQNKVGPLLVSILTELEDMCEVKKKLKT